jgi:hypothetical protein
LVTHIFDPCVGDQDSACWDGRIAERLGLATEPYGLTG